ncbi:MAG: hypothetical protein KDA37_02125 [Planctomycetales bacterium]|nr:hypothetical protein [Planctomycetales bacterium]
MNNPFSTPHDSLESTLLAVLSGEATDDDIARLRKALSDSEQLRRQACEFLYDDALIRQFCTTEKKQRNLSIAREITREKEVDESVVGSVSAQAIRAATLVNTHGISVAAIAASLMLALGGYIYTLESKIDRLHSLGFVENGPILAPGLAREDRQLTADMEGAQRQVLGRVAGLDQAVWSDEAARLEFGDKIELGQKISLESGVVELLLSSGAKVTIEGPARFEATSALEATLELGRIAAAAPRVARGYTVLTPTSELVDIGTQFGVLVDEVGDSELHVFDGDVVARSRGSALPGELIHARENEAMRFRSANAEPERFAARKDDFVRHLRMPQRDAELPRLPQTDQLRVWYSSDMCTEFSIGDRVTVWRDLLAGDNDFPDDAWQFDSTRSPMLIQDEAGRPVLRFDGWATYLQTSPIEPHTQQTICIVCFPAPNSYANDLQGQMLLKYGEAPSMEIAVVKQRSARGWVWPGHGSSCVAELRSSDLASDRPSLIVYEYDCDANQARLWVDGALQGESDAPVAVLQPGCKYIGCHSEIDLDAKYFGGLYEMAIYDKCFQPDELKGLTGYFQQRYGLD